jgi:hypothetical protein
VLVQIVDPDGDGGAEPKGRGRRRGPVMVQVVDPADQDPPRHQPEDNQ